MSNRQLHDGEKTHHPVLIHNRAIDAVTDAALAAQAGAHKISTRTQKLLRTYPLTSVGVSLATGVLVGAVAHRLLVHKQTFGEALAERLGINRARARVRRWV